MRIKSTNQIIAGILLLGILLFVYFYMLNIILYFIFAWVFSMMGMPVMNFIMNKLNFRKWKAGSSFSAVLVILIFILMFSLFFVVILPPLLHQIEILTNLDYNLVFEPLQKPLDNARKVLIEYGIVKPEDVGTTKIRELIFNAFNFDRISHFFSNLLNVASNFFVAFGSTIFITFFFLKDNKMFTNIIISLVPEKYTERITLIINEISSTLRRYFSGIALQMFILFLFVYIVLSIFRIKDALIIAFFAAFLNVIPYIGPMIGAAFGILIVFTNNIGFDFYSVILNKIIIVGATFMAMQTLDNYIIQPLIYSDKIKAHPLEIFVIILVGAKVYGMLGMVLAIPVYIIIRAIAKVFFSHIRAVQQITAED
ncbi:MAG: AI-2E family transporter [Deltaproteobacteria bacterium]